MTNQEVIQRIKDIEEVKMLFPILLDEFDEMPSMAAAVMSENDYKSAHKNLRKEMKELDAIRKLDPTFVPVEISVEEALEILKSAI